MIQPDSRCPACGAQIKREQPNSLAESSTAQKKEDDRETDHRGVVMPRRTRIGGIIMPQ
jgi:hypothetical protein